MIDQKTIDFDHAPDGMIEQSFQAEESGLCGAGARIFPDSLRIPRSEWRDRIAENDKFGAWPKNYSDHTTHQGSSSECVSHATQVAFSTAYNRAVGIENAVWFSPLSLYSRICVSIRGGAMVQDGLRELMSGDGFLPEHDGAEWLGGEGGQRERFKHSLHRTAGFNESFVRPKNFPDGWEETARHFTVIEAYTIPDEEAHASALLDPNCSAIVNGRKGHSIPHVRLVYENRKYLSEYQDSYDRWLFDSERLWGGGFCIRVVNYPDDPTKPAGTDMKK